MDIDGTERVARTLEEIRDLQRQLLDSHQEALRNQDAAVAAQGQALARQRKLQVALGIVIAVVLLVVLVLLRLVLQF